MKLRHARAIAVFVIVFVALTGARRGGGGCDDDSSHAGSSHGSSGGGSGGQDVDSSAPATPSPSSTTTYGEQDVTVDGCELTPEADYLGRARLTYRVTNGNTDQAAGYEITFAVLRTSDKQVLTLPTLSIANLAPGKSQSGTITEAAATADDDMRTLDAHCIVSRVTKTNL
ncbi:hypothetical protein H9Y04_07260 [Streptomyces sp. TRM66268-LWL]|uniref:Secreted protein n=1 Tax=Streptomyces polyasparticus TaxID=2767826 RepID=A0ABR7SAB4_9ACTN|nr:hypothetical protein [Streptomyces polyasparticus]MBC9712368.1 hypothetical protein [Streptomyces polyasparticus]